MAFVRARLFLDGLPDRAIAHIIYEETAANAPLVRSLKALGHSVAPLPASAMAESIERDPSLKDTLEKTRETQLTMILVQVNSN
ncbi:hypothetical protein [Pseudokordiimonas caeni]|uniref:hypothetical protein n=1 Tax=Pseudokordiimonas caeni TaxID=2997908 RepID=UPI0028116DA2|nr:hypothetical protein [Pseudokordiimonas caeni]